MPEKKNLSQSNQPELPETRKDEAKPSMWRSKFSPYELKRRKMRKAKEKEKEKEEEEEEEEERNAGK